MKQNKTSSSRRTTAKPSSSDAVPKRTMSAAPVNPVAASAKSVAAPAPKSAPKLVAATAPTPVAKAAPETKAKSQKTSPVSVPSILLEGDHTATPAVGGPGHRYSLGPTSPAARAASVEAVLPESYGTQELFLTARDPHWLYAAWDLSAEQLRNYNALSVDRHLILKIFKDSFSAEAFLQIHVHPESRNWFVPVTEAATKYLAELGYHSQDGKWVGITKSAATLTPPDSMAEDTSARFATIETDVPFSELLTLVKTAMREHVPLVEALQQLRTEGFVNLPSPSQVAAGTWTPAQEKALGQVVSMDQVRRVWIGSLEITELVRRQLQAQVSSLSIAQLGAVSSPLGGMSSVSSVTSPFGGMERGKGFWFNVNAELIIYGATEPDAKVTIGGRAIKLRPDGSFSFRFALPDGDYSLPAVAVSADGDDSRCAALKFSRSTDYQGDVGRHPQDPALKPPVASSVAIIRQGGSICS